MALRPAAQPLPAAGGRGGGAAQLQEDSDGFAGEGMQRSDAALDIIMLGTSFQHLMLLRFESCLHSNGNMHMVHYQSACVPLFLLLKWSAL